MYLDHSKRRHAKQTYLYKAGVYKLFYQFLKKDFPIKAITPKIISEYLDTRGSNNNYNVHRKELSALFTYAEKTLEVIDRNPVQRIETLPHTPAPKVIPKEGDVIKLLLVADPKTDEKDLLIVLLHTLARIDEVLRMKWEDVNFQKKEVTKWTRKTKDGSYKAVTVSMNKELFATLWSRWNKRVQDVWVFYNEKTEDRYNHRPKFMKGLCKRAGIKPYFTFHTLRHLMASLMGDNPKISTKTIQKILGHSEARTTEIYIHSLDGAIENAMDAIAEKFALENEKPQPKVATS